jgi:hypothetical protein
MENRSSTDNDIIKHLEFIQNAITRMGVNSFQMKGWAVTVFSALLALFAASGGEIVIYLFVAIIPTALFWFLDTYYLQQERKFRGVYNDVAGITPDECRQEVKLFDMPLKNYEGGGYTFWSAFRSRTICPLYSILIAGALVGGIFILFSRTGG